MWVFPLSFRPCNEIFRTKRAVVPGENLGKSKRERERERGDGRGKKNHTICGISRVRWANEPRFSTNLIFIPLVFFVTRPPLFLPRFEFILRLGLLAVLSRCTVHLGFSSLRLQEFFVYAIIINFGPTSMENASEERVCERTETRRRARARARELWPRVNARCCIHLAVFPCFA